MMKVLRILEGDLIMDSGYMSTPGYDVGSRSGRIWADTSPKYQRYSGPMLDEVLDGFNPKLSFDKRRILNRGKGTARTSYDDDDDV